MKALFLLCAFAILSGGGVVALASVTQDQGYPPYVMDKKLHATNDLRGKKAPKLHVAKWVSGRAPVSFRSSVQQLSEVLFSRSSERVGKRVC